MSINRTGTTQIRSTTGVVVQYGGASAPTGWVLCDGTAYDGTTATYAALWAVIGITYGGTGQSSFKVPDLRGRTAVGSGTGTASGATAKTLGSIPTSGAGGEETHLLTGAQTGKNSVHTHGITDPTHNHTATNHTHNYPDNFPSTGAGYSAGSDWNAMWAGVFDYVDRTSTDAGSTSPANSTDGTGITATGSSSAADASSAHNIMQSYTVVNYIIKL